jgi:FdhE protein
MTAGPLEEAGRLGDPAPLRLPDPRLLFEARAARLETLAAAHAAADWLRFLSRLAAGQALAVREVPPGAARAPGEGPPLAWARLPRDAAWRRMLAVIAAAFQGSALPVQARDALARVAALDPAGLEALAGEVLAGEVREDRVALAPFAGAALQAWFASLAAAIDPAAVAGGRGECPVCGFAPVAGIVQSDRLRYVTCALCTAQWNSLRVQCVLCGGEKLEYLHAEGAPQGAPRTETASPRRSNLAPQGAPRTEAASPRRSNLDRGAKAEACGSCRAYLKLFDEEHRPGADAAADDAATIALDLLVADEGYHRAGPNLYVAAGVRAS